MATKVDLRQLAVDRDGSGAALMPPGPRRQWVTRAILPGLLLAGFAALAAYAAREHLSPARPVTVVPVLVSRSGAGPAVDMPLFRAAGWVEPRPTPTLVTALTEGVVEELLAVEGQAVRAGETVARLIAADAKLALDAAEADVELREGELEAAQAALTAARVRLDNPIHLHADLADAEAALAKTETELANLPFQVQGAQARAQFARADWEARAKNVGAVPEISVAKARSDVEAAAAAVTELQSRLQRLPAEVAALKDKRDAVAEKLRRKTDEVRQAAESAALLRTADARLRQAQSARDAARLRLARTEVKSPTTGRVLAVVARPGMRLSGLNPGSLHDSSTVVTLYDPASLQVRVDVRLDDVGKVLAGQRVKVESAAVPGRALDGVVLMATSQADVQKNTLSVKVAVTDPPVALKPDMLCQVTFLAPPRATNSANEQDQPYSLLVPRQLVESSDGKHRVWVADRLTGTARLRPIDVLAGTGDLVEVVAGLGPSDKLIVGGRDGLCDGETITVTAEDETLGIAVAGE